MEMTMSSIIPSRMVVITSVQRRRRWTPEQKLEIDLFANQLLCRGKAPQLLERVRTPPPPVEAPQGRRDRQP